MDALRLSDADRQQALEVLSEHFAEGRLTRDEFDERSDAVWSAKTHGDLSPVFADLPTKAPAPTSSSPARTRSRPGGARRVLVPVFLLLLAITIVTHLPFVLIAIGIGFLLFHGPRRWAHGSERSAHSGASNSAYNRGNRFEARGSCW